MNKNPKLEEFIYISEHGFYNDIKKYCGSEQAELVNPLRTEYVLREIGEEDLADELFIHFEKGDKDITLYLLLYALHIYFMCVSRLFYFQIFTNFYFIC